MSKPNNDQNNNQINNLRTIDSPTNSDISGNIAFFGTLLSKVIGFLTRRNSSVTVGNLAKKVSASVINSQLDSLGKGQTNLRGGFKDKNSVSEAIDELVKATPEELQKKAEMKTESYKNISTEDLDVVKKSGKKLKGKGIKRILKVLDPEKLKGKGIKRILKVLDPDMPLNIKKGKKRRGKRRNKGRIGEL